MAKLEPYVEHFDYSDFDGQFISDLKSGKFDDYDVNMHFFSSGMTPKKIVEEYLASGKYFNIDCPGGIEQMVKDYYAGKFG